ncbi:unnamed protein product [Adineta ricciae]|uniref:Retrotransposon gag domain-containing protein n=1 Tax=Adineta ricciae TaxID=249248 RepID=A0A815SZG0_ADIRI|nr:unnamed protein product [Adineta ricciae]CAF1655983.1 unnamed protein product [Adineta ricciae]
MASSEEKKVPLNEAVRSASEAMNRHDDDIRSLQKNVTSLQTQLQTSLDKLDKRLANDLRTLRHEIATIRQSLVQEGSQANTSTPATDDVSEQPTHQPFTFTTSDDARAALIPSAPNTIIVPPISSFPTFSGKPTDRPRQFLLRVGKYTRTVNKWSTTTLLKGISQFLKDSALEWYCQLHVTNTLPTDWEQFVTRFLAQFHSPIRIAQQEHEWDECKQTENETINEFVVRLRSIWFEQKPDEIKSDFIKHLFCKMRPDMLTLMNATRSASLDFMRYSVFREIHF